MGDSAPRPLGNRNALLAIAVGGGIAGVLDLLQASILFGWKILPPAYWGGKLSKEVPAPMVSVSCCTSLSLARQRLFTMRQAAV